MANDWGPTEKSRDDYDNENIEAKRSEGSLSEQTRRISTLIDQYEKLIQQFAERLDSLLVPDEPKMENPNNTTQDRVSMSMAALTLYDINARATKVLYRGHEILDRIDI